MGDLLRNVGIVRHEPTSGVEVRFAFDTFVNIIEFLIGKNANLRHGKLAAESLFHDCTGCFPVGYAHPHIG